MPYQHVYVHVPFCARRCSYCDFAIAVRSRVPVTEYADAIARELEIRALTFESPVDTLYFGGGTPSRLGPAGVTRLMEVLRARLTLAPNAEVTLEANPDDVHPGVVASWREAGINRVSLGVQSFAPNVLQWMHRSHDVADVERAAATFKAEGIEDWSLDLIYALPPEVARDWDQDIRRALELAPPHISAYGLTVETATPLARWRSRGVVTDADEERYEADFLLVDARLRSQGYEHYEVSNFARPGMRARHNSAYWKGVPYLALGPGAHGFDGETRRWNEREYSRWRERISHDEDPLAGSELLSPEQRELERLYVALRTTHGEVVLPGELSLITPWLDAGWGVMRGNRLTLTPLGWLRLDALVAALTEHRSR